MTDQELINLTQLSIFLKHSIKEGSICSRDAHTLLESYDALIRQEWLDRIKKVEETRIAIEQQYLIEEHQRRKERYASVGRCDAFCYARGVAFYYENDQGFFANGGDALAALGYPIEFYDFYKLHWNGAKLEAGVHQYTKNAINNQLSLHGWPLID